MHGPGNAEVEDDVAFQAHERCRKIFHAKARRVFGRGVELIGALILRVGAEEVGGIARNGEGLGIADGVEHHVQRIAADIAHGADAAGGLFDKGTVRDAATAAAAGLDVIDLAQHTAVHDALDHLHVFIHARLEADGEQLAALFLGAHDFHSLFGGDAHGLFQQHVHTRVERVDGGLRVGHVIGAVAHRVELFRLQHGGVVRVIPGALHAPLLSERFRLAGDQVGQGDDFHIVHLEEALNMGFGDPAGADNAVLQLAFALFGFCRYALRSLIEHFIAVFCHDNLSPLQLVRGYIHMIPRFLRAVKKNIAAGQFSANSTRRRRGKLWRGAFYDEKRPRQTLMPS